MPKKTSNSKKVADPKKIKLKKNINKQKEPIKEDKPENIQNNEEEEILNDEIIEINEKLKSRRIRIKERDALRKRKKELIIEEKNRRGIELTDEEIDFQVEQYNNKQKQKNNSNQNNNSNPNNNPFHNFSQNFSNNSNNNDPNDPFAVFKDFDKIFGNNMSGMGGNGNTVNNNPVVNTKTNFTPNVNNMINGKGMTPEFANDVSTYVNSILSTIQRDNPNLNLNTGNDPKKRFNIFVGDSNGREIVNALKKKGIIGENSTFIDSSKLGCKNPFGPEFYKKYNYANRNITREEIFKTLGFNEPKETDNEDSDDSDDDSDLDEETKKLLAKYKNYNINDANDNTFMEQNMPTEEIEDDSGLTEEQIIRRDLEMLNRNLPGGNNFKQDLSHLLDKRDDNKPDRPLRFKKRIRERTTQPELPSNNSDDSDNEDNLNNLINNKKNDDLTNDDNEFDDDDDLLNNEHHFININETNFLKFCNNVEKIQDYQILCDKIQDTLKEQLIREKNLQFITKHLKNIINKKISKSVNKPKNTDKIVKGGINEEKDINSKLAKLLGYDKDEKKSWTQVTKDVWKYIDENDLKHKKDARIIVPNNEFKKCFNIKTDEIKMLDIPSLISSLVGKKKMSPKKK